MFPMKAKLGVNQPSTLPVVLWVLLLVGAYLSSTSGLQAAPERAERRMKIYCNDISFSADLDLRESNQKRIRPICEKERSKKGFVLIMVFVNGKIDQEMLTGIENAARFAKNFYTMPDLVIDSAGGDVESALKIARLVHSSFLRVSIRNGERCLSACVLIFAGAKLRWNNGTIGVHRPIETNITTPAASGEALARKYDGFRRSIAQFFREMGVSSQVLELMMSTPSSKIRYLSHAELNDFGLGSLNVAAEEMEREKRIRDCGPEYDDRKLAADAEMNASCPSLIDTEPEVFRECIERVMKKHDVWYGSCKR